MRETLWSLKRYLSLPDVCPRVAILQPRCCRAAPISTPPHQNTPFWYKTQTKKKNPKHNERSQRNIIGCVAAAVLLFCFVCVCFFYTSSALCSFASLVVFPPCSAIQGPSASVCPSVRLSLNPRNTLSRRALCMQSVCVCETEGWGSGGGVG